MKPRTFINQRGFDDEPTLAQVGKLFELIDNPSLVKVMEWVWSRHQQYRLLPLSDQQAFTKTHPRIADFTKGRISYLIDEGYHSKESLQDTIYHTYVDEYIEHH